MTWPVVPVVSGVGMPGMERARVLHPVLQGGHSSSVLVMSGNLGPQLNGTVPRRLIMPPSRIALIEANGGLAKWLVVGSQSFS